MEGDMRRESTVHGRKKKCTNNLIGNPEAKKITWNFTAGNPILFLIDRWIVQRSQL
jgi:hypothetical protein